MGQVVLLAFAVILLIGGVFGYRAGSKVSLIMGAGSGLLLLVAWFVTRTHMSLGLWIGVGVSLLLVVSFGMRVLKTGRFMPAGALLTVSVVSLGLLLYSVIG